MIRNLSLIYDGSIIINLSKSTTNIEYWPEHMPVKKRDRFDLLGPAIDPHGNVLGDKNIPIAVSDSTNEVSSTLYKRQKLIAAYKALSIQGYKLTDTHHTAAIKMSYVICR